MQNMKNYERAKKLGAKNIFSFYLFNYHGAKIFL